MTPKVWNVKDPACPQDAVLIDRTTLFGNPYRIRPGVSREQVIADYVRFLHQAKNVQAQIRLHIPPGTDVKCHCAPLPCHGGPILAYANGWPPDHPAWKGTVPNG